jgi:hypothetical protein
MYVFLLIFGVVFAAAGIALVGSGVSIQEHTFDPTIMTPGAVALVGGLVLIGLGLTLRLLGRIERALAARPVTRIAQADDAAISASATERPNSPPIQFPPIPAAEPDPQPVLPETVAAPAVTPAQDMAERLREKFPSLVRLENAPVVEETDVSLLPKPPVRADEELAEANSAVTSRQSYARAPARTLPRLEASARTASRPDRAKNLDAFWPRRKRPEQEAQAVSAQPAMPAPPAEPVLPLEQAQGSEPAPAPQPAAAEAPTPVSILKSGVVDGMAYTLYSDGSIEAQLPQGMLRFGSITELRNHIEQSA